MSSDQVDTTAKAEATASNVVTAATTKQCTNEDLIELIRAVKFSDPDASMRNVHKEITTKMSEKESFEFLRDVKLNDVKKVWKKALTKGAKTPPPPPAAVVVKDNEKDQNQNQTATKSANNKKEDEILKFYTVGDGSVKLLAQEYTIEAAENTLKAAAAVAQADEAERAEELKKYVHCFLDLPLDRSGKRPHQALINFNKSSSKSKSSKKISSKGDGRDIVKIQVAVGGNGKDPMLLYNATRTAKTFIHPSNNDEGDEEDNILGYDHIRTLITTQGDSGALGAGGGTKAYFYARITRREEGQDIISIDVSSGLAPAQNW